jgi:hypothetical protein
MTEDEHIWDVKRLLFDYVKSPSLRHIRDPHSITRLAQEIVRQIDRGNSIWRKWDGQREVLLKSAVGCWIPIEDMRDFLNWMPGPNLTATDVAQRLKAFEEEDHWNYPKEELQAGCLALYGKEKAEGTELPAIIGLIRDHVEREEERLHTDEQERYRQLREENRVARAAFAVGGGLQMDSVTEIAALVLPHQRQDVSPVSDQGQEMESVSREVKLGRRNGSLNRDL